MVNNLRFEKYNNRYFESCVQLIKSTWNFHLDFINIPSNTVVYEYYLKTCLNWNDHLDIIVDEDNNIKGVLFGSKEDISVIRELCFVRNDKQINKWKNQQLKQGAFGAQEKARRLLANFALNDKLAEQDADLFDSEINLFIVSPELKGKGLGRQLMDRYIAFCKKNDIETAFLWTDLDCNYSFYLNYGFKLHNTFQSSKQFHENEKIEDGMVFYINVKKTQQ